MIQEADFDLQFLLYEAQCKIKINVMKEFSQVSQSSVHY